MLVAVHVNKENPAEVLGVWGPPDESGLLSCCYADPSAEAAGRSGMESWPQIRPKFGWERWVEYLSGRVPYVIWWSGYEVTDGTPLEVALVEASAAFLASAAAVHGTKTGRFTTVMMDKQTELALAGDWAGLVAHRHGGPAEPFVSTHRLSSRFAFRADEATLLVAPAKAMKRGDADKALAYGLAHAGDRDLWLVLPEDSVASTRERLAFTETKVRLFAVGEGGPAEVVPLAATEVLDRPRVDLATGEMVLGDRQRWVQVLVDWAESIPGIRAAHRGSYLAWHCEGRLVLKIRRTRRGLVASAGVHHTKPTAGQKPPVTVEVDGDVAAVDLHRLIAAASAAAADRLDGTDAGHGEHRLQAMLTARDLGLVHMVREFAIRRPGSPARYVDFVGVDQRGDIHVVETKIGNDEMLVLQGLDYWIWAQAHLDILAEHFGLTGTPKVRLDLVVAEPPDGTSAIGPYTAAQAEALTGQVSWRFHTVTGWTDGTPLIQRHRSRTVPPTAPRVVAQPRFAVRLGHHLAEHAHLHGNHLRSGVFHPDAADGLVPAAVEALEALRAGGLDHRMVGHVRSSQAFALNLFAPLESDALRAVVRRVGVDAVKVEPPVFEFSDPHDRLAEATKRSPHTTQIDVVLRCRTADGARHVVLIEVKLSETDFGHCSAFAAADNPRRTICHHSAPFGANPAGCFQLTNRDGTHRRTYDDHLGDLTGTPLEAGCPFRYANQPMRNVALARALLDAGETDRATVALCAHEAHTAIWRRWAAAKAALDGVAGVDLADIPASAVLQYHRSDDSEDLAERYLLDGAPRRRLAQRTAVQGLVDAMFPTSATYVNLDERGNPWHELVCFPPVVSDVSDQSVQLTVWEMGSISLWACSWWVNIADLEHAVRSGATELTGGGHDQPADVVVRVALPPSIDPARIERQEWSVPSGHFDFDFVT